MNERPQNGESHNGNGRQQPGARPETGVGFEALVGESQVLKEAIQLARKVAGRTGGPILIMGETGTGKELFARGIHYAGPEPGEPFVAVNCGAIPPELLESELFGHEAGAFTGATDRKRGLAEVAGRGTLFLDEVGELPQELQPKLLRVLESGSLRRVGGTEEVKIRCRVVVATNRSLEDEVQRGRFREDLFYRLNVYRVRVPPLRERGDDIPLLARYFLDRVTWRQGGKRRELTPQAVEALNAHSWPGNVRELRNTIERAALLSGEGPIGPDDLRIQIRWSRPALTPDEAPVESIHIPSSGKPLERVEAEAIQATLKLTEGNQSAASRILGISRPTLARKIKSYSLWVPGRDKPPPQAWA